MQYHFDNNFAYGSTGSKSLAGKRLSWPRQKHLLTL